MHTLRPVTHRRLFGRRSRAGWRRRLAAVRPQSQGRSGREDCHPQRSHERVLDGAQLAPRLIRHGLAVQLRTVVAHGDSSDAALARPRPLGIVAVADGPAGSRGVPRKSPPAERARPRASTASSQRPDGPLYNSAVTRSLGEVLWWIADGRQVCPPHRWGCPVIMKLAPEHVAWTCGRCGAVALSDDLAARPAETPAVTPLPVRPFRRSMHRIDVAPV